MKKMLLILSSFVFAQADVSLSLENFSNDQETSTVTFDIMVENSADIAGYQFDIISEGVLELIDQGASGGLSAAAGFMLSNSATTVIAFSLTGSTIPANSSGVLCSVEMTYEGDPQEVMISMTEDNPNSRLLFSGSGGVEISSEFISYTTESLDYKAIEIHAYNLSDNYPNPFNPSTNIDFSIASYGDVSLVIFDALGREVNELVAGVYSPGNYSVAWSGIDNNGNQLSSGMYFYKLSSGDYSLTKKMLFMK
jgi:hypothetical protein